jgi:hypothetical protein
MFEDFWPLKAEPGEPTEHLPDFPPPRAGAEVLAERWPSLSLWDQEPAAVARSMLP